MELRNEIESLALWYIPTYILAAIISSLISGYVVEISNIIELDPGVTMSILALITAMLNLADNVVVGVWLFIQGKREKGKAGLWLFFGLAAHLFAALFYIGLKIYEVQKPYDKSLNQIGAEDGPAG